jgi:hypothetical protein
VGRCSSWRWSSGACAGGERRWQEQRAEREAAMAEEDEAGKCQGNLFVISKKFRDPSVN